MKKKRYNQISNFYILLLLGSDKIAQEVEMSIWGNKDTGICEDGKSVFITCPYEMLPVRRAPYRKLMTLCQKTAFMVAISRTFEIAKMLHLN
jgi:hypothetical protein